MNQKAGSHYGSSNQKHTSNFCSSNTSRLLGLNNMFGAGNSKKMPILSTGPHCLKWSQNGFIDHVNVYGSQEKPFLGQTRQFSLNFKWWNYCSLCQKSFLNFKNRKMIGEQKSEVYLDLKYPSSYPRQFLIGFDHSLHLHHKLFVTHAWFRFLLDDCYWIDAMEIILSCIFFNK